MSSNKTRNSCTQSTVLCLAAAALTSPFVIDLLILELFKRRKVSFFIKAEGIEKSADFENYIWGLMEKEHYFSLASDNAISVLCGSRRRLPPLPETVRRKPNLEFKWMVIVMVVWSFSTCWWMDLRNFQSPTFSPLLAISIASDLRILYLKTRLFRVKAALCIHQGK